MSLSLSLWQRLIIVMMLFAGAVFTVYQAEPTSSGHTVRLLPYSSDYLPESHHILPAARPSPVRRHFASLAQKHRVIPAAEPAPVASAAFSAAPQPAGPLPALSAIQAYAEGLVGKGQFGCLDALWNNESGWNYQAENPSGAFGIPQALPGSKMAVAGADWQTNPYTQVKWGVLFYIDPVYGSACGAWAHEQATGWY